MLSHAHAVSHGFILPQVPATLTRFLRVQRARFIAAQTRRALAGLTAREMEDIGITPKDIDRVARRSAGL